MNRRGWVVLAATFVTCSLWGASKAGKSTAQFLKVGVGGRGAAMGEAQTASVNDVTGLYWNPAGLAGLSQNEAAVTHNSVLDGVNQDVVYVAHPTKSMGVFGGGGSMVRVAGIRGVDEGDVDTGSVGASDILLTLSWARPWNDLPWLPGLQTGISLKGLRKTLDDQTATGYLADVGVIYHTRSDWSRGFRWGAALQNAGTGLSFGGEKSPFPTVLKWGAAYSLFGDNMELALDALFPNDGNPTLNTGLEYRVWEILAFRTGFKGAHGLDSGLTFGFGLGNERLHLDYGFQPAGDFGDSHRVSLSFRFGAHFREEKVIDQVEVAYRRALARYAQGYLVEAYMQASQILTVAPWHRPAKLLAKRIETEFKNMELGAQTEQLQAQVDEHFARGEQFFQVDDLIRSRREFQAILALQPDHMGAKTYLNRIDDRFLSLTEKFYTMALEAFALADYQQAGDLADKVLNLNPDHVEAKDLKTRVANVLKEVEAIESVKRLNERKAPLLAAAKDGVSQKRYEEALGKAEEVLALDTSDAEALGIRRLCRELIAKDAYNEALRAARENNMDVALAAVKKALRHKFDYEEAKELQASLLKTKQVNDEDKSKELYKEALDEFLNGNREKAKELATKAVELNTNNVEAHRMLDRLANKEGTNP